MDLKTLDLNFINPTIKLNTTPKTATQKIKCNSPEIQKLRLEK